MENMKIKWKDFKYILDLKKKHIPERIVCSFHLIKNENKVYDSYTVEEIINPVTFVLMYPFLVVMEIVSCLWSGGLTEIDFKFHRTILKTICWNDPKVILHRFLKCEEIWNKYIKK